MLFDINIILSHILQDTNLFFQDKVVPSIERRRKMEYMLFFEEKRKENLTAECRKILPYQILPE